MARTSPSNAPIDEIAIHPRILCTAKSLSRPAVASPVIIPKKNIPDVSDIVIQYRLSVKKVRMSK